MFKLLLFSKGNEEYVVIVTDPTVDPSEFARPGFKLSQQIVVMNYVGDIGMFPQEVELVAGD